MKRIFVLFLFFLVIVPRFFHVYADTPIGGVIVPGVTCGIAGDTDAQKAKCCIPEKQDNSVMTTLGNTASGLPIVGDYFGGLNDKITSVSSMKDQVSPCAYGVPSTPTNLQDTNCICIKNSSSSAIPAFSNFCNQYFSQGSSSQERAKCMQCMDTTGGFYTAIGCIPLDLSTFITNYILNIGIGIAGGVALLCIFYSAFRMQTSMGNAEAIKKAQENLTACITGLVIIIFSVLILKIIGVDILRIPGLGK